MPVTTFMQNKPKHPNPEIQGMLEELSAVTGETWFAEGYTVVPARKGFLGLFKRDAIYGTRLYKTICSACKHRVDFSIETDTQSYQGEVQVINGIVNDHDLHNYLLGALGQTTDQQNVARWFNEVGLQDSMMDKQERAVRFLEEALELVQSCGIEQTACKEMLAKVYGSNPLEMERRIFTSYFTLNALCEANELSLTAVMKKHLYKDLTAGQINAYREKFNPALAQVVATPNMDGVSSDGIEHS